MITLNCPSCFRKWQQDSDGISQVGNANVSSLITMGNVNLSGETLCWVCAPKAEKERIIQVLLTTPPSDVCDWSEPDHTNSRNVEFLEKFNENELRKLL